LQFHKNLISSRFANISNEPARQLNTNAEAERLAVLHKMNSGHYVFSEHACMSCGAEQFDVLAERDRYGFPIQTTACQSCGFIQTNPDMRDEDYTDFYIKHYRKLYIADLVGEPEDFFKEERWRGQQIVSYVMQRAQLPKGGLVVEIGCGAGGILHCFKEKGFRVIGTDFGEDNMAHGRQLGLDLRSGDLFSLKLDETPALIIYSHVLEHIRDLDRQLAQVKLLLGNTGFVYVEVPGVKDVHRNVFQADFLQTFHLAHIYNFTRQTMINVLGKSSFSLVDADEEIRSLFRVGNAQHSTVSDHRSTREYINKTEKNRAFYKWIFQRKSQVRSVINTSRRLLINTLHKLGLYQLIKRMV
jgi:SAM-dependent methyltransferase